MAAAGFPQPGRRAADRQELASRVAAGGFRRHALGFDAQTKIVSQRAGLQGFHREHAVVTKGTPGQGGFCAQRLGYAVDRLEAPLTLEWS